MSEPRAHYDVSIERDADGLPTRLYYSPSTPVYPDVALESHDLTPCVLCGGIMVTCGDLDLCSSCGSRRVRSQAKPAAAPRDMTSLLDDIAHEWVGQRIAALVEERGRYWAGEEIEIANDVHARMAPYRARSAAAAASRDASLTAFVDDLLDLLQDVGGMSAEWCAEKLAAFERMLGAS